MYVVEEQTLRRGHRSYESGDFYVNPAVNR